MELRNTEATKNRRLTCLELAVAMSPVAEDDEREKAHEYIERLAIELLEFVESGLTREERAAEEMKTRDMTEEERAEYAKRWITS